MLNKIASIIRQNEENNVTKRRLSSLEKAKVSLKFLDMNENPDNYLLNFRFLQRDTKEFRPTHKMSKLDQQVHKLADLLNQLDGGQMPDILYDL